MQEDGSYARSADQTEPTGKKAYLAPTFQALSTQATQVKGPPGVEGATTSTNSAS